MRRILAVTFALSLALLLVSRGAQWWSEKWWFASLDQSAAWWIYMKWRAGAFAVAAPLWLAIVGLNLRLAWRHCIELRAPLSLLGGGMGGIAVGLPPSLRLGRTLARVAVWGAAALAGLAAANRFDLWVLLAGGWNDQSELGFFLLRLPAIEWFFNWLGTALSLTFVACLTLYFWLEPIETGPGILRASELARAHLSLLGALLIAWKGADCALAVISAPVVFGDSTSQILGVSEQLVGVPASQFFAWSALPVAALIFWLGARDNGNGKRALFTGALWLLCALVVPALAPSFARSLGVGNDAAQHEIVAQHLAATRRAWGFPDVQNEVVAGNAIFADTVLPAPGGRAPIALWPLDGAQNSLDEQLNATPLRAARAHIARDPNGLVLRAIATRRALLGESPARQIEAPVDEAGALGWKTPRALDSVLLSEAAPTPQPQTSRLGPTPRTATAPLEPLPRFRLTSQSRFAIERASMGACFALAARFFDASLLAPGPPMMLHLDPVERARNLAPFVNWSGAIAHPVVQESGVGPHVYWIVEGCLTSRTHPNAATLPGSEDWAGVNYARQNVTAVFDGTSGKSDLYLFDRDEILSRVWNRAVPGLFRPIEEMPAALRAEIQPSPAWLNALTRIYARYHPVEGDKSGDEIAQWETRQSEWRPILGAAAAPTPQWNDALLPGENGELARWQLSAFAPARGRVESGDGVAALAGIAGVTLQRDGSWRWQQWRPNAALPLPAFATPPQATYNSETGVRFAPPTRVGVFPTFDAAGRAEGFTAFRAQVLTAKNNAPALLEVKAATTSALSARPAQIVPLANSLARARDLWNAILAARRRADWTQVANLEAQLSRALDVATPSATPSAKPSATPPATPAPN